MTEWDTVGPSTNSGLKGFSLSDQLQSRGVAEALRGRLDITAGFDGLEIKSTSFVDRVEVGPLQVFIAPKLPAMPLTRLLRYAYGLRDISAVGEAMSPTSHLGLHDILIALLAAEVEELLHRGLARQYVPRSENLSSPRGQILVETLIRQGGVREASLPCRHFDRRLDWHLNRVLRAGCEAAARMAGDAKLRRHVYQLATMFGEVTSIPKLTTADIDGAEHSLTRMTTASRPALTIIRLLHSMRGVAFDAMSETVQTPGFLFDMNLFFQRLVSRFLHDNLGDHTIVDERAIREMFVYPHEGNPRRRKAPAPRPDFALFSSRNLQGFLDAKYRDIWNKSLPAEWLYQLSVYALASPSQVSVLLYACMSRGACDEQMEIRQPVSRLDSKKAASVIFRPVVLPNLAALVAPGQEVRGVEERRQLAAQLVQPQRAPRSWQGVGTFVASSTSAAQA